MSLIAAPVEIDTVIGRIDRRRKSPTLTDVVALARAMVRGKIRTLVLGHLAEARMQASYWEEGSTDESGPGQGLGQKRCR